MTKYDKVLLYHLPSKRIHGAVIDAFEYFFAIYEYNRDFKLIIIDSSQDILNYICEVMENRYDLSDIENYKDNIILIKLVDLITTQFNKVFISSRHTEMRVKDLIFCNRMIITSGSFGPNEHRLFNQNHVTYYGEMPFDDRDIEYNIKVLFKRFKPLNNVREGLYINSPNNKDMSFVSTLPVTIKPIIFKEGIHLLNMFEMFSIYIYYHANKWFDVHPRLFLECAFYNKEIHYFNNHDIKDGSYYRYNDLLKNGLDHRFLDENDEIVKEFYEI